MYSQNQEERVILEYFKNCIGTVLDIGANDGITLSNSLRLIENGWSGIMVEPSKKAFEKLAMVTHGPFNSNPKVWCFNAAIASEDRESMEFYESGSHLGNGDTGLLSTLKESEVGRWFGTSTRFQKTVSPVWSFSTLLNNCKNHTPQKFDKFDLISIDAEGMDWEILRQIDLDALECKMLIIEWNSDPALREIFVRYCAKFKMSIIHQNYENLIFVI